MKKYQTFEEFWPYYVGEHRDPLCRALHYAGTSMAVGTFAFGALTLNPFAMMVAPVLGYGPAWVGHFFCGRQPPSDLHVPALVFAGRF